MNIRLIKLGIVLNIVLWLAVTMLLPAKISLILGFILFIGMAISLFWAVGIL